MKTSSEAHSNQIAEKKMVGSPETPIKDVPLHLGFEGSALDLDYFVKTLSGIKAKGVQPDLIGSIITHYASKWLPDLDGGEAATPAKNGNHSGRHSPSDKPMASLMKKRFLVETIVGLLPPEPDAVPCAFVLRLLRTANLVGAEPRYVSELERRAGQRLDHASLEDILIPAFSHTCGTLLDVGLVLRLVMKFLSMEGSSKNASAMTKVAKLTDGYLAEAAIDGGFTVQEFEALAGILPSYARITEDGLYRAVDTYLKTHPGITKSERKRMCRLIDCRKLSLDACLHAAQNERLLVRTVIQVVLCEQARLNKHVKYCSNSFNGLSLSPALNLDAPSRCQSKREAAAAAGVCDSRMMQSEIRRLKEELMKLRSEFQAVQAQMETESKKKKKSFFFPWKAIKYAKGGGGGVSTEKVDDSVSSVCGAAGSESTPQRGKNDSKCTRAMQNKNTKFRNSLS